MGFRVYGFLGLWVPAVTLERSGRLNTLPALTLFAIFSYFVPAQGAEFSIKPSLAVSEEYNDNVFETRDNRKTDYITRVLPGIALKYNAPFWDWDVAYNFDYRYYVRDSRTDDNTHNLNAKGFVKIIDEFLLLDVSDVYSRVSLDVSRDRTKESLIANQSDSNIFTVSPYFQLRPGAKTTVKTGYRYVNTWYRDPTAVDKREQIGFIDATYELSAKVNLTASYTFTRQNSINPYDRHAPYVGVRYEYADKSFVFAQGGYTWVSYRDSGEFNKPFWNTGITHVFGLYTVTLASGVRYPEDPQAGITREKNYSLTLTRALERGSVGCSAYHSTYDGLTTAVSATNRSKVYGGGIMAQYELTGKLSGNLTANVERYEYRDTSGHTRRIYVAPGLGYSLPWDLSLALNYAFIDYDSNARVDDNYVVNRVILEARKVF